MKQTYSLEHRFLIHLQWFAAEEEGRTEEPTDYRIRKAREEGNVAKSADLTSALLLLFGLATLLFFSGKIIRIAAGMMKYFISLVGTESLSGNMAAAFGYYLFLMVLPIMAVCFIAAFLGNVAQVGFLFSVKPITPDFSRIQPKFGEWARRSIYSGEAIFNLFKSIFKVIIIAVLAYVNIRLGLPKLISTSRQTPIHGLSLVAGIAIRSMLETALFLLIFAIPDFYFQRRKHRESLKMSKHEAKEEFKEQEGDPLVKNRLRQRMQEILSSSMARVVPEADVVITNPTHFAVALKWRSEVMRAPRVTAKGMDSLALRIREIAKEAEVPIVENKPLARALYDNVAIGDEIPEEYWDIVSVVLSEVYHMSGRAV